MLMASRASLSIFAVLKPLPLSSAVFATVMDARQATKATQAKFVRCDEDWRSSAE